MPEVLNFDKELHTSYKLARKGGSETAKYTFEALKTNNVMNYYKGTKSSFYYWQWKILNKNIK